jgi:anti-sigma factor RsiW
VTDEHSSVNESDLQAFIDDHLPPQRRAEVASYLAAHPQEAARLRAYREQNVTLHAAFDPVLGEAIPTAMLHAPRRSPWQRWLAHGVAAALYVLVGIAGGWWLHGVQLRQTNVPESLVMQAATAHAVYTPEKRHPVEVTSDQEAHLVKWLSKRLGAPVHAPNLSVFGYQLVGGRLLPAPSGAAAQFMFEGAQGNRLTLYVVRNDAAGGDAAFRFARNGDIRLFYWIEGPLGYALVGKLARAQLLKIATAVYHDINR